MPLTPSSKARAQTRIKSTDNINISPIRGVDQSLVKRILDEVLEESPSVEWKAIIGQEVISFYLC